jgi:dTDP-4-dehydrorhamnose reductase
MSVLITGSTGRLGRELKCVFPDSQHPTKAELDIRNDQRVNEHFRVKTPDIIIHTAALTGIKQCEEDKRLAWATNVNGTENLVKACRAFNSDAYFVYISTACVFYGDRGDYTEGDIPNPKNFYALTKLVGEAAVRNSGLPHWLVVRTNFVSREKWPYPKAFIDRFGSYLFADDLALALAKVMGKRLEGVLHITGKRRLSMYELARLTTPEVHPMSLGEYQGPPLTVDMTLKSERIESFDLREVVMP